MARRQLEVSNEVAAELAGSRDAALRTLEEQLDCGVFLRGNVITLDGDRAACSANMMGTHVYTNHSGGPIWTVGGRHDYQLKRTPDGWRIAGLTFTIQWATGNMNVLNLAMAAGQP